MNRRWDDERRHARDCMQSFALGALLVVLVVLWWIAP